VIIPLFLVLMFGGLFLYLTAGVLFESGRNSSSLASRQKYISILNELRQHPDSKALQSEARYLGRNFVSFFHGSQGRSPSESDFNTIELEIEDAIQGRAFRSHMPVSDKTPRSRAIGCIIWLVAAYVVFHLAIVITTKIINE